MSHEVTDCGLPLVYGTRIRHKLAESAGFPSNQISVLPIHWPSKNPHFPSPIAGCAGTACQLIPLPMMLVAASLAPRALA